jgi:hypothetical protein
MLPDGLLLYKDAKEIVMGCRTEGTAIHYTLDGSEPTEASPLYTAPFVLDESVTIRARAFKEGMQPSPEVKSVAVKAVYRPASTVSGLRSGVRYTYHTGEFSETADVRRSPVKGSGVMEQPSIQDAPDEDHFGYIFTGYIDIPGDSIWNFSLRSDDGAILEIDGDLVVDNDGSHSAITTMGAIPLLKGLHPFKLIYLEDYEGQSLFWAWRPEGEERFQPIPAEKLYYR